MLSPPGTREIFSPTLTEEAPKLVSQPLFLRNLNSSEAATLTSKAACQSPLDCMVMSLSQLLPPMVPMTDQGLLWLNSLRPVSPELSSLSSFSQETTARASAALSSTAAKREKRYFMVIVLFHS